MSILTPTATLRAKAQELRQRLQRNPTDELAQMALLNLEHQIEAAEWLDDWTAQHETQGGRV